MVVLWSSGHVNGGAVGPAPPDDVAVEARVLLEDPLVAVPDVEAIDEVLTETDPEVTDETEAVPEVVAIDEPLTETGSEMMEETDAVAV